MKIQLSEKEIIAECVANLINRDDLNEAWKVVTASIGTVIIFTEGDTNDIVDKLSKYLKESIPRITKELNESHPNNRP